MAGASAGRGVALGENSGRGQAAEGGCSRSDSPLAEVASLIDEAQGLLSKADRIAREAASGKASLYIQGARGNLRLATEIVGSRLADRWEIEELGVALVVEDPVRGIGRRVPLAGNGAPGVEHDASLERLALPARGCLGVDLLASARTRDLASRPVFGSLLASALGHHEWLSLGSGARWQPDPANGAFLASMLGGGRPVVRLASDRTGGLVDRMVVDELGDLGWRLLRSPTV